MPRDTPYSGVAAMFRSSLERGEPPQVFEDGGQMRDFVHVDDVARANVLALGAVVDAGPARYDAYNVCSGEPGLDPRRGALVVAAAPAPRSEPEVTGAATGSATCGTSSPRRAGRERPRASPRRSRPTEGLPEFATAPLRG